MTVSLASKWYPNVPVPLPDHPSAAPTRSEASVIIFHLADVEGVYSIDVLRNLECQRILICCS